MPAYSFQPRFVEPIRAGTKGGTIRAPRKAANCGIHSTARQAIGGHAYPGEELSLYCRQRQPSGFLITHKRCVAVEPVHLDFRYFKISLDQSLLLFASDKLLDAFAAFDGFTDFNEMAVFWSRTHNVDTFDGWHIRWLTLPREIAG